ncbi:hypothetical protein [Hyalangium versicolor]|uniref:hypothetical protein n=1 Tax=Hyalangium versicolor TaxID=2861190 RepID=UPI001CCC43BD|nr:hypothetical protein [Hyalangium versicolor]
MNRIVWSAGGISVLAASVLAVWLHQPVQPEPVEVLAEPLLAAPQHQETPPRDAASAVPARRAPPALPSSEAPLAPSPSTGTAPPSSAPREEPSTSDAPTLATQLRHRIVLALRGQYPTPLERRDAILAEFLASGESQEPWTLQARAGLDRWRELIGADVLPVRAEPSVCFAAGCLERVTFPDPESYAEAHRRVPQLQLGDVGPHMQLPPEYLPSGEVIVSWAVLRPEPL